MSVGQFRLSLLDGSAQQNQQLQLDGGQSCSHSWTHTDDSAQDLGDASKKQWFVSSRRRLQAGLDRSRLRLIQVELEDAWNAIVDLVAAEMLWAEAYAPLHRPFAVSGLIDRRPARVLPLHVLGCAGFLLAK